MPKRTLEEKCLAKYETAWRTALTMADNDKTVAVGIFQAITKAEVFKKAGAKLRAAASPKGEAAETAGPI